jgi:O-acetyl-ADP-ribose deacetylase (regulator of RNase III)
MRRPESIEIGERRFVKTLIRAIRGDITDQETDAIVNAANSSLLGGGGVDGAIHSRGGPKILEECRKIREERWPNGLPPGRAVVTTGGNLKARFVVHTVGPIWHGGRSGEDEVLAECYRSCLDAVRAMKMRSISFPSISIGAYGFPLGKACPIALTTVKEFLTDWAASDAPIYEIRFVLFSEHDLGSYLEQLDRIFPRKG